MREKLQLHGITKAQGIETHPEASDLCFSRPEI